MLTALSGCLSTLGTVPQAIAEMQMQKQQAQVLIVHSIL